MNGFIRGPLTAAATLAATLTLGMGGIAFADTTEPTQDCTAKTQQLTALQAKLDAAFAPIGVDTLEEAQDTLDELLASGDEGTENGQENSQEVIDLRALLSLGTQVSVAQGLVDQACAEQPDDEQPPADTDEPEQPEGLTVEQARARIAAFTCVGGVSEAFGRLQDEYLAVANELSVDLSAADRGKVSDAYFAKLDELNYCFPTGTTPTPDVVDQAGDTVNVGGSSSNSQFESTPSIAPETGLL